MHEKVFTNSKPARAELLPNTISLGPMKHTKKTCIWTQKRNIPVIMSDHVDHVGASEGGAVKESTLLRSGCFF